ncbi:phage minor capsid protein [Nonomuraea sp. NPDC049486]|uniref:phage minor capsid protein n=1 Tax=Nonomuraea sp. NPDC049486 TaxID=3155773 RepID=UPI0034200851
MAVDQDLLDRIAGTIADLYREVETALVRTVAQRLRKDLPSPFQEEKLDAVRQLQETARRILAKLQAARAGRIREAIAAAYRTGQDAATVDLPASWDPTVGPAARQAVAVIPNARLMENLAQALHRDVGRVDANILRAPVDAYRAVQAGAAARIASGAYTRREASQAAWQALMDKGISSFTDRANRRWRLSSYVEMMARTNIQRAATQGQTDRLQEIGIDLVYVSDNVQECKRCRPFESKVLRRDAGQTGKIQVEHATRDGEMIEVDVLDTLAGAMAKGLMHPNCRHSVSAYLPGVTKLRTGTADPNGDKARQKQRALERRIRAAKEAEVGALTPEAKKQAAADVRAAQEALRAHLKQHPFLKRLPYREQIGAGNIPRGGEAPGGPITDLTPPPTPPTTPTPAVVPAPQPPAPEPLRERAAKPEPKPKPAPKPKAKPSPEPEQPRQEKTLADRIASGERSRTELSGGMYGDTSLVVLNDGSKVVHKVTKRTHISDDAVNQADAEELGGKVARALGVPAPQVHRVGPTEMYQEFMEGKLAESSRRPTGYVRSDDGWRMGFLDALVDYPDRHGGNWLHQRGRLISIDHGLAFRYRDKMLNPIRDGRPVLHKAGTFETLFMREIPNNKGVGKWIDNDLSPADIDTARQRLTQLRPDFQQLGRLDWWEAMMARLEAIAPHAKGDKRRIT